MRKHDHITIHDLEVFCRHGVYKEETALGQKFLVDAVLALSTRKAGLSDRMEDSVSYGEVCRLIEREMTRQNDRLLERVAERITQEILLTFPGVDEVEFTVKKPWAPVMMHLDYAAVRIVRGWHTVYVGVGSNLGDRKGYLDGAFAAIGASPLVRDLISAPYYETEPYGYTEQEDFLNTVFRLRTLMTPYELLAFLSGIEQEAGRTREIHWGPRTLDLDILLYDDLVTEEEELVIPHPELEKRRFVLKPLCDLFPYGVHPLRRERYASLLERLEK